MERAEAVSGDAVPRRLHRQRAVTAAAIALLAVLGAGCGNPPAPSSQLIEPRATTSSSTEPPALQSTTAASMVGTETTPPATVTALPAPPATVEPTTTSEPLVSADPLALDVLTFVVVANEHNGGYVRDLFGYPADLDGDSCDTRSEVLQRDSTTLAQVDPYGCTVVAGDWLSLYDGVTVSTPGELEIDHVVSLKEAWDSGAWAWTDATRLAYANDVGDTRTLRAVSVSTNRSKSDKDPSNWLPPDSTDVCSFISDWVSIKTRWGLSMDSSEFGRIRNLLEDQCQGSQVAPSAMADVSIAVVEPVVSIPPATPPPSVEPATPPSPDVYYANCTAARAAGAAPLHAGEPGYRSALDRDKDGVACE